MSAVIPTNSSDAQLSDLRVQFIRFQVPMAVGTKQLVTTSTTLSVTADYIWRPFIASQ